MSWRDDQVFRAVAHADGYASAAAALGLSHGTVRACVERVEARLGSPLFTHAPEGLTPTAAALSLGADLDRAANIADLFERLSTGPIDSDRGVVRVGVGSLIGSAVLPRLWTALMAAHPGLNLEIVPDYVRGEQPVADGALDVAIVGAKPARPDVEGRRIGVAINGVYAHKDYLAAAGRPSSREDLRRFAMVGPVDRQDRLGVFARMGLDIDTLTFAYRTDHRPGQVAAIKAGLGVGYLPVRVGDRDGDLVRVLPDLRAEWDVWLATRRDMAQVRRIALVRDAMLEGLGGGAPH